MRTICFVVDNINSNVYFYTDVDTYPMNYNTDLID